MCNSLRLALTCRAHNRRKPAEGEAVEAPAEPASDAHGDASHEQSTAAVDPSVCSTAAATKAANAFAAGDFTAACAAYTEALVWAPGNAALYVRRAEGLLRLERADDALADVRVAVSLRPRSAEAHATAGAALQQLKRHADAAASFERALELDPKLEVQRCVGMQLRFACF